MQEPVRGQVRDLDIPEGWGDNNNYIGNNGGEDENGNGIRKGGQNQPGPRSSVRN